MEKIGIILSAIWLSIMRTLLYLKWDAALKLNLNEWGDFLAGMMAPLAFLWLIVGYGLQRKELKENTEALLFQRDEMASQAKELTEQAKYMEISATAAKEQAREIRGNNTRTMFAKRREQRAAANRSEAKRQTTAGQNELE